MIGLGPTPNQVERVACGRSHTLVRTAGGLTLTQTQARTQVKSDIPGLGPSLQGPSPAHVKALLTTFVLYSSLI